MTERPVLKLKKNRSWTQADDDQLRAMLVDGKSIAQVAQRIQRTGAAIRNRAQQLRVSFADNLAIRAQRNSKRDDQRPR